MDGTDGYNRGAVKGRVNKPAHATGENGMSDKRTVRLHAIVHGDVQGVNFRSTTQREAVRRGLTGWVCNRWDGTVETVAEGPPEAVEQFEAYLHRGPSAAYVTEVDVTYRDATGEFRAFNIRY
jgi:acylphosphatase